MEKPGSGDKIDCTLDQIASICRDRANSDGKDRAASCRPPSVLAPGSALGSCRRGALSTARAVLHRGAVGRLGQWLRSVGSDCGPTRRSRGSPAFSGGIQLAIPLVEDRPLATGQLVRGRALADRAVKPDFVVMRHELRDEPPRVFQAQRCLDADALALEGLVPPLDLPVALGII
jgi:hypothetical protein